MKQKLELIMIAGPSIGARYVIQAQEAIIGRSRVSDIFLMDDALSRQHCRVFWNEGAFIEDLGSSNGTYLNDRLLESGEHALQNGSVISIGEIKFLVCITFDQAADVASSEPSLQSAALESEPASDVQRLFTPAATEATTEPETPATEVIQSPDLFDRRGDAANDAAQPMQLKRLLFPVIAILILILGIVASRFIVFPLSEELPPVRHLKAEITHVEFHYERLLIDAQHLFRYVLSYDGTENLLTLSVDDLGDADRSFKKREKLTPEAKSVLIKLIKEVELEKVGTLFPERSPDGVTFNRRSLTLVRNTEVWSRVSENVTHQAFDELCEKLEFFAKNELKVWAAQYSIGELEQIGQEQLEVAKRYWEQRDLGDDKAWLAIVAYKKGLSALETLNPKPVIVADLNKGLQEAEALLTARYEEANFLVEQAMNTQRYEHAIQQLQKIIRMIPDREDARNRHASERLLTVEQRRNTRGGY